MTLHDAVGEELDGTGAHERTGVPAALRDGRLHLLGDRQVGIDQQRDAQAHRQSARLLKALVHVQHELPARHARLVDRGEAVGPGHPPLEVTHARGARLGIVGR